MKTKTYDVAVIGGGVAGVAAALAAARRGAKTVLIEKTVAMGGLATNGLVLVYLALCDGLGHQVSFGITEELLKLSNKYGPYDPKDWKNGVNRYEAFFSPASLILALDEMLAEAGVELWFDTVLVDAEKDANNRIVAVEVFNKSGKIKIEAKCFIDATGDADLAFIAGNECLTSTNALVTWVIEHRNDMERDPKVFKFNDTTSVKIFANPLSNVDTESGISGKIVSDFVIRARKKYIDYINSEYAEGFSTRKTRYPISLPSMPTMRKTRCIKAVQPLVSEMEWQSVENSVGVAADWRKKDSVWELPYGMLLPDNVEGMLAVGRAAGAVDDAWEVSRVIPVAAVTGEAAGVAAAIAVKYDILPSQVEYSELAAELQKERFYPLKIKELGLEKNV